MGKPKGFFEAKYAAKKRRELGYKIDRKAQYRNLLALSAAGRNKLNMRRKNNPEQFYIVDYECNETNEVWVLNLFR